MQNILCAEHFVCSNVFLSDTHAALPVRGWQAPTVTDTSIELQSYFSPLIKWPFIKTRDLYVVVVVYHLVALQRWCCLNLWFHTTFLFPAMRGHAARKANWYSVQLQRLQLSEEPRTTFATETLRILTLFNEKWADTFWSHFLSSPKAAAPLKGT